MANTLRIKRRTSGATGAPASLANAELAFNEMDDTLWYGKGTGGGGGTATAVEAIAGKGAVVMLTGNQSVGGTKSFIGTLDATGGAITVPTVSGSDSSQKAASTAWVRGHAQPLDADLTALAGLSGTGGAAYRISADTWALRSVAGASGRIAVTNGDGIAGNPTIDLATIAVGGSGTGTHTKLTVDTYGRVTATAQASLTDLASPTADFSFGSRKITSLADPTNPQDAATKAYVDLARQGLDAKQSVRVASTANVSLSAPGASIDGVTLATGDRVLLTGQTAPTENGIWVWTAAGTALARAPDADTNAKVTAGMFVFTEEGTSADKGWVLATDGAVSLGTTALAFTIFNTAGATYTFSTGLTNSGGTITLTGQALAFHQLAASGLVVRTAADTVAARAIAGTAGRVAVANGSAVAGNPTIDIDAAYAGQASITTLGTVGTGVWQGTAVAVAYGGTGATDAATARNNLGLGTMATQAASGVNITGGSIIGLTTFDNVTIDAGTF